MGRKDQFSHEAKMALYEYLIDCEGDDLASQLELDVIALCCDYSEDAIENVLKEYNLESLEELQNQTVVIWDDGTNVLYQNY